MKYRNLAEMLRSPAEKSPERPAYIYLPDGETTEIPLGYGELDRRARAVAVALRAIAKPGDRILLLYPPGPDFIVGLFACFYGGFTAVPLFPPEPERLAQTLGRFLACVSDSQAGVVLSNRFVMSMKEMFFQFAPALGDLHWLGSDEVDEALAREWRDPAPEPRDLALLMYTSGSTGEPKGVMLGHGSLLAQLEILAGLYQGEHREEKGVTWAPPYHISGLTLGLLMPVYLESCNVFFSPLLFLAQPLLWLKAITRHRARSSGAPNFAYDLCVQRIGPEERVGLDLSCWQIALNGGEPVRAQTLRRFAEAFGPRGFRPEAFLPSYGLTESGLMLTVGEPGVAPSIRGSLVSCGRPLPEVDLRIVDPSTALAKAPGEVGEVWAAGPCMADGYWKREAESEKVFGARLANGEGPFLRTGDLGLLKDGELFLNGRLKELIIVRGVNHYPLDLETTAERAHPALRGQAGAAFAMEGPEGEAVGLVFECAKEQASVHEQILRNVREAISLDHQLRVAAFGLVKPGTLPRTVTKKVQRRAAGQAFLNGGLELLAESRLRAEEESLASAPAERIVPVDEGELKEWVAQQMAAILGVRAWDLDLDLPLPAYGLDSLAAVEFSSRVEKGLGVPFTVSELFEAASLRELLEGLAAKWRAGSSAASSPPDLAAEAVLDPGIAVAPGSAKSFAEAKEIFLTGATGFLGAFFLRELLDRSHGRIHCMVRARDPVQGLKRIRENLEFFQLWRPEFVDRIVPVVGDLAKPRLGLSPEGFDRLAEQIDLVYHNGASVNFIYSYRDLKPTNVLGTQEVIRLAASRRPKALHHVSTIGIFPLSGRQGSRAFSERDEPEDPRGLLNGYAESKWVAEKLVRQAALRGLPVAIYRPGEVLGESEAGMCRAKNDAYSHILKGGLLLGSAPVIRANFYAVPVDFVVKAAVYLSSQEGSLGRTFHLVGQPLTAEGIFSLLKDCGVLLRRLSYDDWLQELRALSAKLPKNPLAPLFPYLSSDPIRILANIETELVVESQATHRALAGMTFRLPSPERTLSCHFRFLERSGFLYS
ncbi:MAG TPA: thioester reductase domain-containing protein [bacterium]|nr:thioester reductase domain-containing protein [bacterium]